MQWRELKHWKQPGDSNSMKMNSRFLPHPQPGFDKLKSLIILLVRKEIAIAFSYWLVAPKLSGPKLVVCEILRQKCIRAWSKGEPPASLQRGRPEEMWEEANTSIGKNKITAPWMYGKHRKHEQWAARTVLSKHVCFCDFTLSTTRNSFSFSSCILLSTGEKNNRVLTKHLFMGQMTPWQFANEWGVPFACITCGSGAGWGWGGARVGLEWGWGGAGAGLGLGGAGGEAGLGRSWGGAGVEWSWGGAEWHWGVTAQLRWKLIHGVWQKSFDPSTVYVENGFVFHVWCLLVKARMMTVFKVSPESFGPSLDLSKSWHHLCKVKIPIEGTLFIGSLDSLGLLTACPLQQRKGRWQITAPPKHLSELCQAVGK